MTAAIATTRASGIAEPHKSERTATTLALWVGRAAIAVTWAYNGLVLKLLDLGGAHTQIVAEATGLPITPAAIVTGMIALLEVAVAVVVLVGWRPRQACVVQVTALVLMNVAGATGASSLVGSSMDLFVRNLSFVALIFVVAVLGELRHAVKT